MTVEIKLINGKEDLLKDVEKIELIRGHLYITYFDKEETIFMKGYITFITIKEDKSYGKQRVRISTENGKRSMDKIT